MHLKEIWVFCDSSRRQNLLFICLCPLRCRVWRVRLSYLVGAGKSGMQHALSLFTQTTSLLPSVFATITAVALEIFTSVRWADIPAQNERTGFRIYNSKRKAAWISWKIREECFGRKAMDLRPKIRAGVLVDPRVIHLSSMLRRLFLVDLGEAWMCATPSPSSCIRSVCTLRDDFASLAEDWWRPAVCTSSFTELWVFAGSFSSFALRGSMECFLERQWILGQYFAEAWQSFLPDFRSARRNEDDLSSWSPWLASSPVMPSSLFPDDSEPDTRELSGQRNWIGVVAFQKYWGQEVVGYRALGSLIVHHKEFLSPGAFLQTKVCPIPPLGMKNCWWISPSNSLKQCWIGMNMAWLEIPWRVASWDFAWTYPQKIVAELSIFVHACMLLPATVPWSEGDSRFMFMRLEFECVLNKGCCHPVKDHSLHGIQRFSSPQADRPAGFIKKKLNGVFS